MTLKNSVLLLSALLLATAGEAFAGPGGRDFPNEEPQAPAREEEIPGPVLNQGPSDQDYAPPVREFDPSNDYFCQDDRDETCAPPEMPYVEQDIAPTYYIIPDYPDGFYYNQQYYSGFYYFNGQRHFLHHAPPLAATPGNRFDAYGRGGFEDGRRRVPNMNGQVPHQGIMPQGGGFRGQLGGGGGFRQPPPPPPAHQGGGFRQQGVGSPGQQGQGGGFRPGRR